MCGLNALPGCSPSPGLVRDGTASCQDKTLAKHAPKGLTHMHGRSWLSDFDFSTGRAKVRTTGADLPITPGLIGDVRVWFVFYVCAFFWRIGLRLGGRASPRLAFWPAPPRPWYLLWNVIAASGARIVRKAERADALIVFDDQTYYTPPNGWQDALNARCTDVSKSKVVAVFEAVSGRKLGLDPTEHSGPMVRKGEINGAHDGAILTGPVGSEPGMTYQRLIDNSTDEGTVIDLRCPTLFGKPLTVFLKERPIASRFANMNSRCRIAEPDAVFSAEELDLIARFCQTLGLDWGGIDVLRDRQSGEIFIVDANKTDMGPPLALPLGDKIAAMSTIAARFQSGLRAYIKARQELNP
jgi:hypothetical protein